MSIYKNPYYYKRTLLIERHIIILDIEKELTALLSEEIAKSIDQQIMNELIAQYGF
jgi:hypothetical protein